MNAFVENLRKLIVESVKKESYQGMLFSGGVDTSVIAAINPDFIGITVYLDSDAEDIRYSKLLAQQLKIKHYLRAVELDEAIEAIPKAIKILKSFNPELPNDLAVYFGLKKAEELGLSSIGTGDGSDELFGGYSFLRKMRKYEVIHYIKETAKNLRFSSNVIGEYLGMKIVQPLLDHDVVNFALQIPVNLKIKPVFLGKGQGKWVLRKAFEDLLPPEIIWQKKRPLELGSGMIRLRDILNSKISDQEYAEKQKLYPVKFSSKAHLYYYEIFKKEVGEISSPLEGERVCPGCGGGMDPTEILCYTCGHPWPWLEDAKILKNS